MATNEFQREMGQLLHRTFPASYRIDDVAFNRAGGRQVSKKPFDFYGYTEQGYFWCVEVKRVKTQRFPMSNLRPHQRTALKKAVDHKGISLLAINWRLKLEGATNRTGIAALIPYFIYEAVEKEALEWSRKSLTPYDFHELLYLSREAGRWEIKDDLYSYISRR